MKRVRPAIWMTAALFLSGCDPVLPGYVNRFSYPIAVVEDPTRPRGPVRLAPGQEYLPGFGSPLKAIDVLDASGHKIAHYRLRDIPAPGGRAGGYIVFTPNGASFGSSLQAKHQ